MAKASFEWDPDRDLVNQRKHGVSFAEAQQAFLDPSRVILPDLDHSTNEDRWFCLGKVADSILTVRFTYRDNVIRLFGAGFWRKGKKIYDRENKIL